LLVLRPLLVLLLKLRLGAAVLNQQMQQQVRGQPAPLLGLGLVLVRQRVVGCAQHLYGSPLGSSPLYCC
jgi:hypothetical protein